MSTRLFPKELGATAYVPSGIAGRCDWIVMSDAQQPHAALLRQVDTDTPRHVFLSLREPYRALAFFWEHVLPRIREPFVLVSGSEDATVPRQLDRRWRPFDAGERTRMRSLLEDSRLLHWFAENLDEDGHPRMSPLPLGLVFAQPPHGRRVPVPVVPPLSDRPLRILCAHRVRPGPQWELRREVSLLCSRHPSLCRVVEGEIPEDDFISMMQSHAFVLCASGGGIDPSPKAWQAILHGAIPIILSSPLDAAYRQLPTAIVPAWDGSIFEGGGLEAWHRQCAIRHDIPANRAETLRRLGLDYWWDQVAAHIRPAAG